MEIRMYKTKDEDQVVALWESCNLVVPWNDPRKDIARKLKVNPELFLVGESEGRIVATVMGGYEGHRGWINYLAVSLENRGQGLGRQMMTTIESRLKNIGCPKINLQVRKSNEAVIRFYQAIGYKDDQVIGMCKRLELDETKE